MSRRALTMIVGATALVLIGGVAAAVLVIDRDRGERPPQLAVLDPAGEVDYDFVIPPGTARQIARGEPVEIVPQRLEVDVGQSIRIRNDDDAGASVGIFYVGAGEVVRMQFTTPGELKGICDVHPSGEFTIQVNEA